MSEPTNPLFEEEKAFLEHKKLEYERALRGDVAQLKEQTATAGRIALVGAGLVGSIWLITKALGGRKRAKQRARYEDYNQGDSPEYSTQYFGDADFADEASGSAHYDYAAGPWQDNAPDYLADDTPHGAKHGAVYHSGGDTYDDLNADTEVDFDDNGLRNYPDFPAHSGHQHGAPAEKTTERFESEAYGHPDSTLPFDDSRRLPEPHDFAESEFAIDQHPGTAEPTTVPQRTLGSMLVSFAKSGAGKIVLGQAASIAMALATKALRNKLPSATLETAKNSDLAAITGSPDGYAHGHPATPQPDATTAPADFNAASHFQEPA